jgi:hypothetical protein
MFGRPFARLVYAFLLLASLSIVQQERCGRAAETASATELRFFEQHVRPLLLAKCIKCHGPEKQENNLRLDSRDSILQGGDSGPAVVPGNTEESLLFEAVNYASLEMPTRPKITDEDRAFWSFRPVQDPAIPDVDDDNWSQNAIDRFVAQRLRAAGITPATEAGRATLIRRLYFDLLGLPPPPVGRCL